MNESERMRKVGKEDKSDVVREYDMKLSACVTLGLVYFHLSVPW